jgi:predicted alpha/beta hydrolase family esterase
MTEFTLLFRGRQNFDSTERAQQNVQRWQAWFKELGSAGHFKDPSHRTPL